VLGRCGLRQAKQSDTVVNVIIRQGNVTQYLYLYLTVSTFGSGALT
jgi:hypothetical protein